MELMETQETLITKEKQKKYITIELTPDVEIFYNKYITVSGVAVDQIIKRRIR